MRYFETEFLV